MVMMIMAIETKMKTTLKCRENSYILLICIKLLNFIMMENFGGHPALSTPKIQKKYGFVTRCNDN